jgi:hypothetical protein
VSYTIRAGAAPLRAQSLGMTSRGVSAERRPQQPFDKRWNPWGTGAKLEAPALSPCWQKRAGFHQRDYQTKLPNKIQIQRIFSVNRRFIECKIRQNNVLLIALFPEPRSSSVQAQW